MRSIVPLRRSRSKERGIQRTWRKEKASKCFMACRIHYYDYLLQQVFPRHLQRFSTFGSLGSDVAVAAE